MPAAIVNEIELHYRVQGDPGGPPVLFIPGLGTDHRLWLKVVSGLRDEHRCILFDNRDSGRSGRAKFPYTIREMADDTAGLVHHLGLSTVNVAGYSMGGAIAQQLALDHPDLVQRLVLVATYTSSDPRGVALFQTMGQLRQALSREEYFNILYPWVYTHEEYRVPGLIDQMLKNAVEDPLFQEQEAYQRQRDATTGFHSEDRLGEIPHPTLLIFGEEDLMTPVRFARTLHRDIPQSRLCLLGGAGHGLVLTRATELAGLIAAFLGEE